MQQIASDTSVAELLDLLEIHTRAVAIELNREILSADFFAETQLQADDALEIVTLVGGG